MRRRLPALASPLAGLGLLSAAALLLAPAPREAMAQTYIITDNDGYGTAECMAENKPCGAIVADAWCRSKGFAQAESFRPVQPEDLTGSIRSDVGRRVPTAFVITCKK
jgi:hypothetical protein